MCILRNDGVELMQLDSDANASYNISVRTKGKYYPLGIDARNGTDIVTNTAPDFDLLGARFEPGKKSVANVNPLANTQRIGREWLLDFGQQRRARAVLGPHRHGC